MVAGNVVPRRLNRAELAVFEEAAGASEPCGDVACSHEAVMTDLDEARARARWGSPRCSTGTPHLEGEAMTFG